MQPFEEIDGVRMATVDEIVAMKVDVVQRVGRKKDFWDLHQVMPNYTLAHMLELHQLRHEWTHDEALILANFVNFEHADKDFDPICLLRKQWEFIKDDIVEFVDKHR
jgi:hypothetical protein